MAFQVKKLDATVRQGARSMEGQYYEDRRKEGIELKGKYRPGGAQYKSVKNMTDGQGSRVRTGKVSWKKDTGLGDKKAKTAHS